MSKSHPHTATHLATNPKPRLPAAGQIWFAFTTASTTFLDGAPIDHPAARQVRAELAINWAWAVGATVVFFAAIALSEWMPMGFAG